MTDGQTDGRTELRWLRRTTAVAAVARKNYNYVNDVSNDDGPWMMTTTTTDSSTLLL